MKHCPKNVKETKGKQNFKIYIGHNIFNCLFLILTDIIINIITSDNITIIKMPIQIK